MASRAVVRSGRNGLIARAEPKHFANRIEQILDQPERFAEPFALEDFSHDRLGAVYTRLYEEVASRGRPIRKPKRKRFKDLVDEIGITTKNGGSRRDRRLRRQGQLR
jgi:hypothetical protein